jgi:plasmid stabilization system protein ParE
LEVFITPFAENAIELACDYISEHGYPETAKKYFSRMIDFANSLGDLPYKYPICKRDPYAKRGIHCAVFENTYVFVYLFNDNRIVIIDVIHCKRNG